MLFPNDPFGGIQIIQSWAATQQAGRVKAYPKRKAKSESHWRRMDKKWRKRYGFHKEPCMYRMGNTLLVHPSLMPKLRAALRRGSER